MISKTKLSYKKSIDSLVAFLLPIIILGIAYAKFGMYPFGEKSLLISDMNNQYLDFHAALYDIIKGHGSLLYSWKAGLGNNFLGVYAYYLASPLSLLIVFFKKQNLIEGLLIITLLKVALSSLSFSIYSKYTLKKDGIANIIFSVLYSLMAYSIIYSFNIMWLDGIIFLPLVLLGVEKILRENKPAIFLISIFLMFIANFYISYMVGVFSFLYFLATYFSIYSFKEIKLFFKKFGIFIASTLLAAGSAAWLILPTYSLLKNSQMNSEAAKFIFKTNFNIFDLFTKIQIGSYDSIIDGLPNIYCGLFCLLLLPLYFMNKKIPLKERLLYLAFSIFMLISLNFSMLDLAWHGFDTPNWFPYRYSFLVSFLIVNLAFRSFNAIKHIEFDKVLKVYGILIFILILIQKFHYEYLSNKLIILSLCFTSLYCLLIYVVRKFNHKEKYIFLTILFVIFIELGLNTLLLIQRLNGEFVYKSRNEYFQTINKISPVVKNIQQQDEDFYRLDSINSRSCNDPLNIGYNGVAHFSSTVNQPLNIFLNKLGFLTSARNLSVYYKGATVITDSLFDVKYTLSDQKKNSIYEELLNKEGLKAYKNPYVLPLGFMVDDKLLEFKTENTNPFILQNNMLNLMDGKSINTKDYVDYLTSIEPIKVNLDNVTSSNTDKGIEFKKVDTSKEGFVEFIIKNPKHQQVYAYFPPSVYYLSKFYLKDSYIGDHDNYILDLGLHEKDEEIVLKLQLVDGICIIKNQYFYGLNIKELSSLNSKLKNNALKDIKVTDREVKATVDVADNTFLFTSIPFDKGWSLMVDGNKKELSKVEDALIGAKLEKGHHELTFSYTPEGFKLGVMISIISAMASIIFIYKFR